MEVRKFWKTRLMVFLEGWRVKGGIYSIIRQRSKCQLIVVMRLLLLLSPASRGFVSDF
jgi:hypothetical protein